ncbi:hypothetical protein PVK06_001113 [Gossypium arboreum]|uniref:Uncharacterized protein n=1 Tax=Gossypium arboreum TaxID=29729 RepID=A0ABR0R093_GOSAR|nr:hypothetical protein PVK06_001113 [Gossypium arboreum]
MPSHLDWWLEKYGKLDMKSDGCGGKISVTSYMQQVSREKGSVQANATVINTSYGATSVQNKAKQVRVLGATLHGLPLNNGNLI